MIRHIVPTLVLAIMPVLAGGEGASAQTLLGVRVGHDHHESRRQHRLRYEYHHSYYERGYHEHRFEYYRGACETRGGGLSLGVDLGGGSLLSASVGRRWTECDRGQFSYAQYDAFDHDRAAYWHNPDSGRRGVIRPGPRYRDGGRECARARAEVYDRDGDFQSFEFESCRDNGGRWRYEGSHSW